MKTLLERMKIKNDVLKAKLKAREKSIKNLSEWIIEMGTYVDVDIQRDFSGVFDEDFIEEVATCLEDDIFGSKFNLERQDEVIEKQEKMIKAQKEMIHNSNLIITMLAKQLETKYNDELGKTYLEAK
ncbi:hypothetical protein PDJ89_06135 [Bacillus cereus]|nr:hypothetical protein [Bacillus cereus]